MKRYCLFLGCQIPLRIASVEIAARKLFQKLDVELVDLSGYSCCPDPVVSRTMDRKMWLTLSARNLSLAEETGLDLVTLCVGCYETLAEADAILKHEPETKKEIDKILLRFGRKYEGKVKVRHFVEVLFEDLGISKIKEEVKKPLRLKATLHYGCHLFRSEEGEDIWRKSEMMKELVAATGAEVVDYGIERLCCGFPSMHADEEFSLKSRLLPKLKEIHKAKADCVVVVCPACTIQFETGQVLLRRYGFRYNLPCMYLSELLALAFGIPSEELSLEFHRSPVLRLAHRLE
ncbi:CoB--CoM heterodisulfide reductase subunit B [Candidatus Bathyarchaeota archaeon]|nr:CoB--CoM heterodisulfide reductase subunit B [Candidatus Bathyarchaeota archaeon]